MESPSIAPVRPRAGSAARWRTRAAPLFQTENTANAPRQSIIIPTYNERDNIRPLLDRLARALPARGTEVIFVDDSTDDTPAVIEEAARSCDIPVTVHHRQAPVGGLGGAVVEGFRRARGSWIVVMDGDLQHPPELINELVAAGIRDGADLVVASRYAAGGRSDGLDGRYRRLVSRGATLLTKLLFYTALTRVSDPLSGFFAVRRTSVDVDELRPEGYKILLEYLVRTRPGRVVEVPFTFEARAAGDSKASPAEGLRFLRHLARLRVGEQRLRMLAFALIGLSGLAPNAFALWQLTETVGLHYVPAAIIATQVAIAWNFALTEWLFRKRRHRAPASRVIRFFLLGNADLVLRVPALAFLVDQVGINYLVANVVTLVVSFLVRFAVVDRVIYARATANNLTRPARPSLSVEV
jgi:dolichol-phosphate mannosyltransferase